MKVGIEIGGTFTDIITVDEEGNANTHKVSSTPEDPAVGSLLGLSEVCSDLSALDTLLHGSTIATNAVLERKGSPAGLLTTKGFGDILAIQRFDKKDSYDPFYARPEPLIPRSAVAEIDQRTAADGSELLPLDGPGTLDAVRRLVRDRGIESLAVSFLHSYANQDHEQRVRQIIQREFPELYVSLSSDIVPKFREYERTSTTVISAYVKPVVDRYLYRFEHHLLQGGFAGTFLVMQANGGVVPAIGARLNPASMYLSGPAAGVVGAQYLSRLTGLGNLLTLDVGGTSTDLALVTNGRASVTSEGEIGGLPISLPIVDIVSIGSGGGSVAWRDSGGMLRVGPRSSGAMPGPACYGRGGTEPTVTDALVLLGLVAAEAFLGGRMRLDTDAAHRVIADLASEYQMAPLAMAESILRISVANITQATRLVSVQRGHDPRRYAVCAYGGAGPLLAALVADELSVDRVVVPQNPGLFSAFGLLVSDYRRDFTKSQPSRLGLLRMEDLRATVAALRSRATAEFDQYGLSPRDLLFETTLELRYDGQGFELPVALDDAHLNADDTTSIRQLFNGVHLRLYGHNFPEQEIVVISYRLSVAARREATYRYRGTKGRAIEARPGRIYYAGDWHACSFFDRTDLPSGSTVDGPAVISEPTATTFVPQGWRGLVDEFANLILDRAHP